MEVIDDAIRRSRHRTEIAPAQAGPIVTDHAVGWCQRPLEIAPAQYGGHQPRFEHNRGAAASGFKKVKSVTAKFDQSSRRRKALAVLACS